MKTTVKNISDTKVKLTIELASSDLADAEKVSLAKLSKDIKIAGFRKGKAPVSVVSKHVDQQALQEEIINNAINKAVANSFIENKIQALDRPNVEVTKFVPGQTLEFTAEVEILPKITLGKYKNLKAKLAKVTVSSEEIDDTIDRIRSAYAIKEEVKRAAEKDDEVVIDFVGKKDGVAFKGGEAENYSLKLGSGQFIPGFEEGIVGHKAGDEFDIDLTFPENYHAADLKGAKVTFSIKLKTVKAVKMPEIDDELAAKAGPFTSISELKDDIKRGLTTQKENQAKDKYKDELVNELVAGSTVPVPEVLIDDQEKSIEQDFIQNLKYQGLSLDQYLESNAHMTKEVWLDKEVRPLAEKRAKASLVLAELSRAENITMTDQERRDYIEAYKKQYAKNPEISNQLNRPEVEQNIASRLLSEKTLERLVELNSK